MKILVLGASGMAGHMIATYLIEKKHQVYTLSGHTPYDTNTVILDVQNIAQLTEFLNSQNFDIVINCIGLLIKECEEKKSKAVSLNAFLPHFLEEYYHDKATKIIHLSTDCVFSGKNPPYFESSITDGELFYDKVKSVGELLNEKDLTFRMSIIGPDTNPNGIGLFNWFMLQKSSFSGFTNVYWNGITTLELAKAIEYSFTKPITGLYHLVPDISISKYELLKVFNEVFFNEELIIHPIEVLYTNKKLINTRTDFNFNVPDYHTMVLEMKQWIDQHPLLYPHYFSHPWSD